MRILLLFWWLLASLAHAEPLDLRTYADALGDETEALVRAVKVADEIDLGEGTWTFGALPWDDAEFADAADVVSLLGRNTAWVWQHWEENSVPPQTIVNLKVPPGSVWWDQQPNGIDGSRAAGPFLAHGLAFVHPGCTVFSFGNFADPRPNVDDARGNAIRYCSFHGPLTGATTYAVRGIRQYNFEVDHCSFRGASGIELSGDMPTLSHLRMGHHNIAIRTFDVSGNSHVPGTIADVEVEGVYGTGVVAIGDHLHRVSVEVGYAFEGERLNNERLPGRVVKWDDAHYAVLDERGWLGDTAKNRPEFVEGEGALVHRVPAVLGGERQTVMQCRFEVNHAGLDMPQFVVVPGGGPLCIYGVHELLWLDRERNNRPVVAAWCEGVQHHLYGRIVTDHPHLLADGHPLVMTPEQSAAHPFDRNWGPHSTAANNESHTPYRLRDGRWVYRLSDFPRGWTRRTSGPVTVWADDPGNEGLRTLHYPGGLIVLRPGWTTTGELPAGKLSGRGIEVAL